MKLSTDFSWSLFWQQHRIELILFATAFSLRALYAIAVQITSGSHGFIAFSDAEYFYYQGALNILTQHVFSIAQSPPFYPDAFHTPLYSFFIAVLLFLKLPLFGVVLVQDIFAALTVVLIYRIAMKLTNSRSVALGAAILAGIEPMSIYWSGLLMSDVFFAFWVTLSIYLLAKHNLGLSGITLGIATLVRPIGLFFFPVWIAYILYSLYAKVEHKRKLLSSLVLTCVAFAVVVSPWFARNKIQFDTWSLTSAGWYDLYYYPVAQFAKTNGTSLPPAPIVASNDKDFTRFNFEYTSKFKEASFNVIESDVPGVALFLAFRSLYSLVSDRYEYLFDTVLQSKTPSLYNYLQGFPRSLFLSMGAMFWISVYVLALFSLRNIKLLPWWLYFASLVAINALISGGINPGGSEMSRYSLPFYAFFFTFAALGFIEFRKVMMQCFLPELRATKQ